MSVLWGADAAAARRRKPSLSLSLLRLYFGMAPHLKRLTIGEARTLPNWTAAMWQPTAAEKTEESEAWPR